jgi:hypothetical protein
VFSVAIRVIVLPFAELSLLEVGRHNSRAFVASSFERLRGDSINMGVQHNRFNANTGTLDIPAPTKSYREVSGIPLYRGIPVSTYKIRDAFCTRPI